MVVVVGGGQPRGVLEHKDEGSPLVKPNYLSTLGSRVLTLEPLDKHLQYMRYTTMLNG